MPQDINGFDVSPLNFSICRTVYFSFGHEWGRGEQLELPPDDSRVPDEDGGRFISENNFFDFSTVDVLPLEEYRHISEDPSVCPPTITLGTQFGYQLIGESTSTHYGLIKELQKSYFLRGMHV